MDLQTTAAIANIGSFVIAVWLLIQPYRKKSARPTKPTKLPLPAAIGIVVALILNLTLYYKATHASLLYWDGPATEHITAKAFVNEKVVLDGKDFVDCSFQNVTFTYNGTKPFRLINHRITGTVRLDTDSQRVWGAFRLAADLVAATNSPIFPTPNDQSFGMPFKRQ